MGIDIGGVGTMTASGGALSLDGTAANVMKVTSGGIVTRPLTPFMRGQVTGRGELHNGGGGSLMVVADVNRGNCWNNATGYFTCPIAGYYMTCMGAIAGHAGYGYVYLQKNGANALWNHWNHAGGWHFVTLSGVLLCAANDTIRWIIGSQSPPESGVYGEGGHQMYSIALMA